MAKTKTQPVKSDAYRERERNRSLENSRNQSRAGREIGPLPEIVNPERRQSAITSLRFWFDTYHGERFNLPWSADHLRAISKLESAILSGGLFAFAMPRGTGKTSMAIAAVEWAVVCGHHQMAILIGATQAHADEALQTIRTDLETNQLLLEDFPEVCYPIHCLEGIAQRRLLLDGESLTMTFKNGRVVLPNVPGSQAASACIAVAGLTGRIRGLQFTRPDGKTVRPSIGLLDDPQTDESARSASQNQQRASTIRKAVLGLAGPGKKMAAVMPCTVIEQGDLADQFLDRKANPQWQGERTRFVLSWPTNVKLWEEYAEIRANGLRAGDNGSSATEFYRANQAAMDEGGETSWEERHNPDELSSIQHAWNLRLDRGEAAFDAEFQNDPHKPDTAELPNLTSDQIADRITRIPRGVVPATCRQITAFVDIQQDLLYWLVAAWGDGFAGQVIDYGVWPQQRRTYFQLRDASPTLGQATPTAGLEGAIYAGLKAVEAGVLAREWATDNGGTMRISRCLIDANWNQSTGAVYQFCRQSPLASILLPSHGRGITASMVPISSYVQKPGEQIGNNWQIRQGEKRSIRHITYDTNFWKSFVLARFSVAMGDRGALTLFGEKPHEHKLLADHLTAEYRVRTEGRGRVVDEWKLRPDRPDNHWLDGIVGCAVGASIVGLTLDGMESGRQRKKVSIPSHMRAG